MCTYVSEYAGMCVSMGYWCWLCDFTVLRLVSGFGVSGGELLRAWLAEQVCVYVIPDLENGTL